MLPSLLVTRASGSEKIRGLSAGLTSVHLINALLLLYVNKDGDESFQNPTAANAFPITPGSTPAAQAAAAAANALSWRKGMEPARVMGMSSILISSVCLLPFWRIREPSAMVTPLPP